MERQRDAGMLTTCATHKALISSENDPNFRAISLSTKALFFFGTPHRGAAALDTKRLSLLINVSRVFFATLPADLERDLKPRSRELFGINDRFRNITLVKENKISITCFYERVEMANLGDVVSSLKYSPAGLYATMLMCSSLTCR